MGSSPSSRYQLVALDFDGTLADSYSWFLAVFDELADRFRFRRLDRQLLDETRYWGPRRLMQHYGVSAWKVPFIARHVRRLMARDIAAITLFPGIAPALARLAEAGVALAVVTSNSEPNVRRVLGPSAALISHYECGVSLFGKGARLRKLLKQTRLPPERVLLVGDELRDAEAARSAGVGFAPVAWGYTHPDALREVSPGILLSDPAELGTVLQPAS